MPRRRAFGAVALGLILLPASAAADETPLREVIDAEVQAAWQREKITPAARPTTPRSSAASPSTSSAPSRPTTRRSSSCRRRPEEAREAHRPAARRPALRRAAGRRLGPGPVRPQPAQRRGAAQARRLPEVARGEVREERAVRPLGRDLLLAEQEGPELFYVQFRNQPEEADGRRQPASSSARSSSAPAATTIRTRSGRRRTSTAWPASSSAWSSSRPAAAASSSYAIGEKSTGEVLFTGAGEGPEAGPEGRAGQAEVPRRRPSSTSRRCRRTSRSPTPKGEQDAAEAGLLAQGEAGRRG